MVVVAARHLAEEDSQSLLYLGPLKRVNEHEGQSAGFDVSTKMLVTDNTPAISTRPMSGKA
jgi:hypothetical protein